MWPALIAAGASLVGGALNRKSAKQSDATQREFAQHGISWKVADAKAAGLHPLAAIGAQGASYSPTISTHGNAIADAGQDISRAMLRTQDRRDQEALVRNQQWAAAMAEQRENLKTDSQLKNDEVQRQYYNSMILRNMREMSPGVPNPSRLPDLNAAGVRAEKARADKKEPWRTPGEQPAFTKYRLSDGSYVIAPSQQYAESLEGTGEIGQFLGGTIPSAIYTADNNWMSSRTRSELVRGSGEFRNWWNNSDVWRKSNFKRELDRGKSEFRNWWNNR